MPAVCWAAEGRLEWSQSLLPNSEPWLHFKLVFLVLKEPFSWPSQLLLWVEMCAPSQGEYVPSCKSGMRTSGVEMLFDRVICEINATVQHVSVLAEGAGGPGATLSCSSEGPAGPWLGGCAAPLWQPLRPSEESQLSHFLLSLLSLHCSSSCSSCCFCLCN